MTFELVNNTNKKRHTAFLPYQLFCMCDRKYSQEQAWKLFVKKKTGKKRRNGYTRCQFHRVLCAVNRTINHYVYAKGFTVLAYRSRTVGHSQPVSRISLSRGALISRHENGMTGDSTSSRFISASIRRGSLQRERSMQTSVQMIGLFSS